MFKQRKKDKRLNIFKTMPPLYHTLPNKEFNFDESQVFNWISQQPEVMSWLKEKISDYGYIKYNSETGLWMGVDYIAPCGHGYEDWDECPVCRM